VVESASRSERTTIARSDIVDVERTGPEAGSFAGDLLAEPPEDQYLTVRAGTTLMLALDTPLASKRDHRRPGRRGRRNRRGAEHVRPLSLVATGAIRAEDTDEEQQVRAATTVLNEMMATSHQAIPANVLEKAEAIAIFPGVEKAGHSPDSVDALKKALKGCTG
jgi:hypothetical protein